MDKEIVLPKKDKEGLYYLSYSQMAKWKKSKRDYIRKYFFDEPDDNAGLQRYGDFGHKVGEAFENNNFDKFEPEEQGFLKSLPRFDEFETEIRLEMTGFYVLGYVDSNTKVEDGYVKKLLDYKTGDVVARKPEYESEDYIQTEIYSAAFMQKYGKLPDEASVVLIGRSGNAFKGEELKLTGEVEIIPKDVSAKRVAKVHFQVQQIAEEISTYYKAFLELKSLKM